ncbi:MAG: histidinol-phosphate transaminase [Burkholderiales bacterium]|jgi:histidinol-phosphate aminotransferase|nr:histidinol-phosphate transaminase [Burkholderiales bacterium]
MKPDLSILRDDVRAIGAYPVPSAAGMIKLDAMENPFGLPDALVVDLGARLARVAVNRYPPANPVEFKARLAHAMGVPDGMALLLGNGSDELIHLVIQACARPGAAVLSPWPSFVMYEMSARFDGCRFVGVPLAADFSLDREALLAAIERERPAVIFISWPNNPTGNLFDRATVEAVLDAAPGLVVLDEAYLPFALDTWMPQLAARPNLLVLRTLSKLGLAGIRLGYLAGDPGWIAEFDKLRPPYNVNVLTLAAADFMLDHLPLLDEQAATLRTERAHLLTALRALAGITAFDSAANFILFRVADADGVFARLKEQRILIKNVSRMHPLLAGCLRVTVGTPEENRSFLAALVTALK